VTSKIAIFVLQFFFMKNFRGPIKKVKSPSPKGNKKAGPSPISTKAPGEFPMRINKYLAWKGISTRRAADDLIKKKQITINGRFASLGDQVKATDDVQVRNNKQAESYVYYAYNKPRGITTDENRKGTTSIAKVIDLKGVFAVGSLDQNAEGLIILSNDKRLVDRLLNPTHAHPRTYLIKTVGPLRSNFKENMESGVVIGNSEPIRCHIEIRNAQQFILHISGNDSHIRQMCSMFFAEVESLKRISILNIKLGSMPANSFRPIVESELNEFLESLGLKGK
jgi:23S rRNA pseudouridine2604 synthase